MSPSLPLVSEWHPAGALVLDVLAELRLRQSGLGLQETTESCRPVCGQKLPLGVWNIDDAYLNPGPMQYEGELANTRVSAFMPAGPS